MACPICREEHGPERGLSFDGCGVNSCGMYRTRIATFANRDVAALLGPQFAAAPELVLALQRCLRYGDLLPDLAEEAGAALAKAEAAAS